MIPISWLLFAADINFNCIEDLFTLQSMNDTTRGRETFQEVKNTFSRFDLKQEKLNGT